LDWLGVGVEHSLITYCYEIAASANRHFENNIQKLINVFCQLFAGYYCFGFCLR